MGCCVLKYRSNISFVKVFLPLGCFCYCNIRCKKFYRIGCSSHHLFVVLCGDTIEKNALFSCSNYIIPATINLYATFHMNIAIKLIMIWIKMKRSSNKILSLRQATKIWSEIGKLLKQITNLSVILVGCWWWAIWIIRVQARLLLISSSYSSLKKIKVVI